MITLYEDFIVHIEFILFNNRFIKTGGKIITRTIGRIMMLILEPPKFFLVIKRARIIPFPCYKYVTFWQHK